MNYYQQKFTTHQFTYCIYYVFQDKFKYSKIMKIQQVHPKDTWKTNFNILFNFLLATHLNLMRLKKHD